MNITENRALKPIHYLAGLAIGWLIAILVYLPGLSGGFEFDDDVNIVNNTSLAITQLDFDHIWGASLSGISGPLGRPIAMLSFALNYYLTGFDPYYFKLTNLAIHLFNGVAIFVLTHLIFKALQKCCQSTLTAYHGFWISLIISIGWLLHPINLTSVLYTVQRMTSLSTLFTLGGLIFYLWGRLDLCDGGRGMGRIILGVLVFAPLSILSKEIGALMPLFLLVIEWVLFGFRTASGSGRRFLFFLFGLSVAAPALWFLVTVIRQPEWITGGYIGREFTLGERVMTEARILWLYLKIILVPSNAQMGMYHDDVPISHGWLDPSSTWFAFTGIFLLLITGIAVRKRAPIVALGILLFLVGHGLESTIFPLEIAHEHRNYFPAYGILLIVFYYLLYPLQLVESLRLRYAFAIILVALLGISTAARASYWGNVTEHGLIEATYHPNSARASYEAGRTFWALILESGDAAANERYYSQANYYFTRSSLLQKNNISGVIALVRLNFLMEKPYDPNLISDLKRRLEYEPFAPASGIMLISLSECQMDGVCKMPSSEMRAIFQAAFRNPTLGGQARSVVYAAAAMNALSVDNDPAYAVECAAKAVESNPADLQWRINLANLHAALGQLDAAREQLGIIRNLDKYRAFALQIEQIRDAISKATNKDNGNKMG